MSHRFRATRAESQRSSRRRVGRPRWAHAGRGGVSTAEGGVVWRSSSRAPRNGARGHLVLPSTRRAARIAARKPPTCRRARHSTPVPAHSPAGCSTLEAVAGSVGYPLRRNGCNGTRETLSCTIAVVDCDGSRLPSDGARRGRPAPHGARKVAGLYLVMTPAADFTQDSIEMYFEMLTSEDELFKGAARTSSTGPSQPPASAAATSSAPTRRSRCARSAARCWCSSTRTRRWSNSPTSTSTTGRTWRAEKTLARPAGCGRRREDGGA